MFSDADKDLLISLISRKTAGTIEQVVRMAMNYIHSRPTAHGPDVDPFQVLEPGSEEEKEVIAELKRLDDVLGKARKVSSGL